MKEKAIKCFFGHALQHAQTLFLGQGDVSRGLTCSSHPLTWAEHVPQTSSKNKTLLGKSVLAALAPQQNLSYPCWFPMAWLWTFTSCKYTARHENINPFCVASLSSLYSQCQHHGNSNTVTWDSFLASAHTNFKLRQTWPEISLQKVDFPLSQQCRDQNRNKKSQRPHRDKDEETAGGEERRNNLKIPCDGFQNREPRTRRGKPAWEQRLCAASETNGKISSKWITAEQQSH